MTCGRHQPDANSAHIKAEMSALAPDMGLAELYG
jgi:hypothetical protein